MYEEKLNVSNRSMENNIGIIEEKFRSKDKRIEDLENKHAMSLSFAALYQAKLKNSIEAFRFYELSEKESSIKMKQLESEILSLQSLVDSQKETIDSFQIIIERNDKLKYEYKIKHDNKCLKLQNEIQELKMIIMEKNDLLVSHEISLQKYKQQSHYSSRNSSSGGSGIDYSVNTVMDGSNSITISIDQYNSFIKQYETVKMELEHYIRSRSRLPESIIPHNQDQGTQKSSHPSIQLPHQLYHQASGNIINAIPKSYPINSSSVRAQSAVGAKEDTRSDNSQVGNRVPMNFNQSVFNIQSLDNNMNYDDNDTDRDRLVGGVDIVSATTTKISAKTSMDDSNGSRSKLFVPNNTSIIEFSRPSDHYHHEYDIMFNTSMDTLNLSLDNAGISSSSGGGGDNNIDVVYHHGRNDVALGTGDDVYDEEDVINDSSLIIADIQNGSSIPRQSIDSNSDIHHSRSFDNLNNFNNQETAIHSTAVSSSPSATSPSKKKSKSSSSRIGITESISSSTTVVPISLPLKSKSPNFNATVTSPNTAVERSHHIIHPKLTKSVGSSSSNNNNTNSSSSCFSSSNNGVIVSPAPSTGSTPPSVVGRDKKVKKLRFDPSISISKLPPTTTASSSSSSTTKHNHLNHNGCGSTSSNKQRHPLISIPTGRSRHITFDIHPILSPGTMFEVSKVSKVSVITAAAASTEDSSSKSSTSTRHSARVSSSAGGDRGSDRLDRYYSLNRSGGGHTTSRRTSSYGDGGVMKFDDNFFNLIDEINDEDSSSGMT